jgi:hypothetical protein
MDHTILTSNSGVGKLFGKSTSEIIGKKCDELFVGEDAKIFGSCPGDIALEKCERVVVEKGFAGRQGSAGAGVSVYPAGAVGLFYRGLKT